MKRRQQKNSALDGLSEYQIKQIEKSFVKFDTNKSGTIDKHEFKTALNALGIELSRSEISEILRVYDPDNRGLNKENYTRAMAERLAKVNPVELNRKSFAAFDVNGDGKIDIKDLVVVAKEAGWNVDEQELMKMIKDFSGDKDYIAIDDFNEIMNPVNSY